MAFFINAPRSIPELDATLSGLYCTIDNDLVHINRFTDASGVQTFRIVFSYSLYGSRRATKALTSGIQESFAVVQSEMTKDPVRMAYEHLKQTFAKGFPTTDA